MSSVAGTGGTADVCGRYVMARATSDLVALGDAETNEELVLDRKSVV